MSRAYNLLPLKIGCEVLGLDLSILSAQNVIQQLKKDVTQHRILVFRNQSKKMWLELLMQLRVAMFFSFSKMDTSQCS